VKVCVLPTDAIGRTVAQGCSADTASSEAPTKPVQDTATTIPQDATVDPAVAETRAAVELARAAQEEQSRRLKEALLEKEAAERQLELLQTDVNAFKQQLAAALAAASDAKEQQQTLDSTALAAKLAPLQQFLAASDKSSACQVTSVTAAQFDSDACIAAGKRFQEQVTAVGGVAGAVEQQKKAVAASSVEATSAEKAVKDSTARTVAAEAEFAAAVSAEQNGGTAGAAGTDDDDKGSSTAVAAIAIVCVLLAIGLAVATVMLFKGQNAAPAAAGVELNSSFSNPTYGVGDPHAATAQGELGLADRKPSVTAGIYEVPFEGDANQLDSLAAPVYQDIAPIDPRARVDSFA